MVLKTIDAHVSGTAVRLIVDGFAAPHGVTLAEKLVWAGRHADDIRRAVLLEPRGSDGMIGAVLTEGESPAAHAGMLFFDGAGPRAISYEAIIGAVTIALRHGLLMPGGDETLTVDTPAGKVQVNAGAVHGEARCLGVPAFVCAGAIDVQCGGRPLKADLAYAGELVAIVDSESAGVPLTGASLHELTRAGRAVAGWCAQRQGTITKLTGLSEPVRATVFTGPSQHGTADLRTVMVRSNGTVERSPSGTALAAVMAVLAAMDLFVSGNTLTLEGIAGAELAGAIARHVEAGGRDAIVPEIRGRAWMIGEHVLRTEDADPLRLGIDWY